jgi:thiosulfate reductase cytochrome b subunit
MQENVVMSEQAEAPPPKPASYLYVRHALPVRAMHWINVVSLTVLLMSGLMIFNAHPSLTWGKSSYTGRPPVFEITALRTSSGQLIGVTRIFGHQFDTTGVLGVSAGPNGKPTLIAFPQWLTIPSSYSLAAARLWHIFFAWMLMFNGLAYVAYALTSRHLQRNLLPTRTDWRGIGQSIRDHIRLKHPQGEAAKHYNVLQKLSYVVVIFVLLPLIILTGWAMSPKLNSIWPGWVDAFGGRQSARTVHFVVAWLLVAFVAIHVFEVIVSGFWNHLRSMITGHYRITDPQRKTRP